MENSRYLTQEPVYFRTMNNVKALLGSYTMIFNKWLKEMPLERKPTSLYEPIIYTLGNGGKRIRPALMMLCCEAIGQNSDICKNAAIAVEIFHNFTLLHDDIMDQSTIRRGNPSVYAKYGTDSAILSGDAMMILSYQLLQHYTPNELAQIFPVFNETALLVCEGQELDMSFEQQDAVATKEYIEMIGLKTAALLKGSALIGGILAGADKETVTGLGEFAHYTGVSFQLQDDLLDTFGQTEKVGKNLGGDIAQNKKTYLLLKALELANENQKALLNKWYTAPSFDRTEKVVAVTKIFNDLAIEQVVANLRDEYFERGQQALESCENLTPTGKENLLAYANLLLNRDH